jgi:hypothetical protein
MSGGFKDLQSILRTMDRPPLTFLSLTVSEQRDDRNTQQPTSDCKRQQPTSACQATHRQVKHPLCQSDAWTLTTTESTVALNSSKAHVFHALEQLLEQCDPVDVSNLVHEVKTKLANRCYILNAQRSFLLDLPPELLVEIGSLVLASQPYRKKHQFRRENLPSAPDLRTATHTAPTLTLKTHHMLHCDRPHLGRCDADREEVASASQGTNHNHRHAHSSLRAEAEQGRFHRSSTRVRYLRAPLGDASRICWVTDVPWPHQSRETTQALLLREPQPHRERACEVYGYQITEGSGMPCQPGRRQGDLGPGEGED